MADANSKLSLKCDFTLEDANSPDIDDDIDDAIEEGYMGMECTLERGFSLNDSAIQKDLRLDRYEELSLPYELKSFHKKYSSAMKHFVPIRKTSKSKDEMAVDEAGFFSLISFSWVSSFMWKAYKSGLTQKDLPLCSKFDMSNLNMQRLKYNWDAEVKLKGIQKASLHRPVWIFIRTRMILAIMILISTIVLGFLGPTVFMRGLINWMSTKDPLREGAYFAAGLIITEWLRITLFSLFMAISHRTAIRLRAACLGLVYNKLMKISNLGSKNVGEVINLYANDGQRIYDFVVLGPMIIGGPLVAVGAVIYIFYILGPWSLLGMTTFLIFYLFQYFTSRLSGHLRRKTVTVSDKRICLMNEILSCIKLIKMYAWEDCFTKSISDIRDKERRYLEKSAYVHSLSVAMAPTVPVLTAIAVFLIHIGSGNNLTAAQGLSILAFLLGNARSSLNMMSFSVRAIIDYLESQIRIQSFLTIDDMELYVEASEGKFALQLQDASFGWNKVNDHTSSRNKNAASPKESKKEPLIGDEDSDMVLHDLSFNVLKGEVIGVCGSIGAGKSSLLLAVLGQMRLIKGKVLASGSFAYVGQQPWILNDTFRENILLGEPFIAKRYYKVVYACGLTEDISLLPAADNTEIGERGINLSGGQKQRLSLARALYANKDIYLLDDCLSAVDAQVGRHIFQWVIRTALKDKSVIFASHQMQYMTHCDKVLFMQSGKIVEIGTHSQLMSMKCDYFTAYLNHMEGLNNQKPQCAENQIENCITVGGSSTSLTSRKSSESQSMLEDVSKFDGQLTTFEIIEKGNVPVSVYKKYINYSGGPIVAGFVIFTFALNVSSTAFSSWWLSHWLHAGNGNISFVGNDTLNIGQANSISDNPDREFYQMIYGISIAFIFSTSMIRGFAFMKSTIHASSRMHKAIFYKLFRSPMSFFDTTPSGRILNIFSQDLDEVDIRIPITMEPLLQNLMQIGVSFFFVCLVFPYFLFFLLLFAMVFLYIRHIFSNGIRDFKRLDNVLRSPLYSHLNTTINGLNSIQAYKKQEMFTKKFMMLLDDGSSSFFLFNSAIRWLAIRLDLLSMCCTAATAFLSLLLRDNVGAAFAGLALAYSSQLSGLFQFTVRLSSEMEARFTSAHRILNYIKTLGSEGPLIDPLKRPNPHWPKFGRISFKKVCMSYREDAPVILKSISFDIDSNEKIGVVGRTGSGKSSLGAALFRLVELNSGSILIDGLDISSIGLKDLRSHLSIIPQDPVLFIGTIRYNLDPLNCCSDEEIWSALQKTQMSCTISNHENKLESPVIENGENFSIGERQLLCMARALLRKSKIVFLDEATAGIDTETDSKIQKTLQESFENCTVITVAHRLNTIMSCSRILVMNNGKVAEYDSPQILLSRPTSHLSKLVEAVQKGAEIF